jgi:hypothetical protein
MITISPSTEVLDNKPNDKQNNNNNNNNNNNIHFSCESGRTGVALTAVRD